MKPLVVNYLFPKKGRGLAVTVSDTMGVPRHERLKQLHRAVDAWCGVENSASFQLRRELAAGPMEGCVARNLSDYLYGDGEVNGKRVGRHLDAIIGDGTIHRFAVRTGAPVEGPDLFGRETVVQDLLDRISGGISCHLRGPRRYGKTSVLRRLQQEMSGAGRPCVFADLSAGTTANWFFVTLARAAMQDPNCQEAARGVSELSGWPGRDAGPVSVSEACRILSSALSENPWSFGRRLFEALGGVEAVLLLDEFSVFLRSATVAKGEEVKQVAVMLKEARGDFDDLVVVLAGSAGLSRYMIFHNLGQEFDDLQALDVPPLNRSNGAVLTEELLYGADRRPTVETVDAVVAEVGGPDGECVPYFLHVVLDALVTAAGCPVRPSPADVREAYKNRVLGPWANFTFRAYRLGAQPYPDDVRAAVTGILRVICATPEGAEWAAIENVFAANAPVTEEATAHVDVGTLLACLQEDYDLAEADGRWRVRCKPLRERWALSESWLTGKE